MVVSRAHVSRRREYPRGSHWRYGAREPPPTPSPPFCRLWQITSPSRLDAPITLVGLTALSVETNTNFSTFAPTAARARTHAPYALLRTACHALVASISCTCLYAPACKITHGRSRAG